MSKCPSQIWPPPEEIPVNKYKEFTMDGKIPVKNNYFHQRYDGAKGYMNKWREDDIESAI